MSRIPSVIPLAKDSSSRILLVIIAIMTYLAILTLVAHLFVIKFIKTWHHELNTKITIQLPLSYTENNQTVINLTLDAIKSTPGIKNTSLISTETQLKLLEPWLGDVPSSTKLPFPVMIDVVLSKNIPPDIDMLTTKVKSIVPDALINHHNTWIKKTLLIGSRLKSLSFIIMILIGVTAVGTLIMTVHSGIKIHMSTIHILYTIGAHDTYIARQFQYHMTKITSYGSIIGIVLALATLFIIGLDFAYLPRNILPQINFSYKEGSLIFLVPLFSIALSSVTARLTVLRILEKNAL